MKNLYKNQQGIVFIIPVLAAVLVFGAAGTQVYRVQQAKKQEAQLSASQKEAEERLRLANELKQANEAEQKANDDKEKEATAPENTAPAPAPATAPKPAAVSQPKTTALVHPTSADCGKGNFTVYASAKSGTNYYVSASRSSRVAAVFEYGKSLSLECYTDVNGKPVAGWLLYNDGFVNYADVSKTKP